MDRKWYSSIDKSLKELMRPEDNASIGIIHVKHRMGLVILKARAELGKREQLTNAKGHTGKLGEFMQRLSKDLHVSIQDLYDCLKFAETYPNLQAFLNSSQVRTWRACRQVLYSERSEQPSTQSAKKRGQTRLITVVVSEAILRELEAERKERNQTWEAYLLEGKLKELKGGTKEDSTFG